MSYPIRYTDTNTNPTPITVADQDLNTSTSLTFVGKNYSGYSQFIGENFLHLLENFAKSSAPANPIKGQLWYKTGTDTSPPRPQLMVYDGTKWTESGNVKKGLTRPLSENSVVGDLWVDIGNQQLYLFSGANWVLVGPQFSQGTLSGLKSETIIDRDTNTTKTVLIFYTSDIPVIIVSKDSFTPKITISGFTTINAGVNLSSSDFALNGTGFGKYWGTSEKAAALVVGNNTILASNFLRSDTVNTTNYTFNVRNGGGLVIGASLETSLSTGPEGAILSHKTQGQPIRLKPTSTNGTQQDVVIVSGGISANAGRVGINKSPTVALDVLGSALISGSIKSGDTTVSTSTTTGALQVAGGAGIAGALFVGGNTSVAGNLTVGVASIGGIGIAARSNNLHDIGSESGNKFRAIYASSFVGNNFTGTFTGIVNGSVTGSAAKLVQTSQFSIRGDITSNVIPFNGAQPVDTVNIATVARNAVTSTATITTQANHNFVSGYIVKITCTSNATFNTAVAGAVITVTGLTSFTYSNPGSAVTQVAGIGIIEVAPGGSFITTLGDEVISNKTELLDSISTDQFLVYRSTATPALRKISKATLFSTAGTVPTASIMPYAGDTPPTGYLFCDGSEQSRAQYPELYNVILYKYRAQGLLKGLNTFALPDLRGRFPLGRENMENGNSIPIQISTTGARLTAITASGASTASFVVQNSLTINGPFQAGKVVAVTGLSPSLNITTGPLVITSITLNTPSTGYTTIDVSMPQQVSTWPATTGLTLTSVGQTDAGGGAPSPARNASATDIGIVGGTASTTLAANQLPNHQHTLVGDAGHQFYAIRITDSAPSDTGAITGQLHTTGNGAQLLPATGNIKTNGTVGESFNTMNPYQTINYIIFTGRIL